MAQSPAFHLRHKTNSAFFKFHIRMAHFTTDFSTVANRSRAHSSRCVPHHPGRSRGGGQTCARESPRETEVCACVNVWCCVWCCVCVVVCVVLCVNVCGVVCVNVWCCVRCVGRRWRNLPRAPNKIITNCRCVRVCVAI